MRYLDTIPSPQNPTRTKFLETTLTLLEADGGSAIRMSDIAKAAGLSRQTVYLHFPSRAELLIAATRHLDTQEDVDTLLAPSRAATDGAERLALWVEVWGNYIPRVYGIAKALMAMQDSDAEAAVAWSDRMQAVRHGCAAAVGAIAAEGRLVPRLRESEAADMRWTLLSVRNWEQLRQDCGWDQAQYIAQMQAAAARLLLAPRPDSARELFRRFGVIL